MKGNQLDRNAAAALRKFQEAKAEKKRIATYRANLAAEIRKNNPEIADDMLNRIIDSRLQVDENARRREVLVSYEDNRKQARTTNGVTRQKRPLVQRLDLKGFKL